MLSMRKWEPQSPVFAAVSWTPQSTPVLSQAARLGIPTMWGRDREVFGGFHVGRKGLCSHSVSHGLK